MDCKLEKKEFNEKFYIRVNLGMIIKFMIMSLK